MKSKFCKFNIRIVAVIVAAVLISALASVYAVAYSTKTPHTYSNTGTLTYVSGGKTITKTYTDLEDLFDDAEDLEADVTIDMLGDWNTEDFIIEIPKGRNYTLNLHGHVLDRHLVGTGDDDDLWFGYYDGNVIDVCKNATLTINGGTDSEYYYHLGRNDQFFFWQFDEDKGDKYQFGGLITGGAGTSAGGIDVYGDNAIVYLNNVTIVGNVSDKSHSTVDSTWGFGSGINLRGDNCTLEMSGAQITENHSENDGAGIYVDGDDCTISLKNRTIIDANRSAENGGGVYMDGSNGKLYLDEDSTIMLNDAEGDGGGIYMDGSSCLVEIKDGKSDINGNDADDEGGGIYIDGSNAKVKVTTGTIDYNEADDGGGIYCNASGAKIMLEKAGNISSNEARDGDGGGIYNNCDGTSIELDGASIASNTAEGDGAGLYLDDGATVNLKDSSITKNKSEFLNPSGYVTPSGDGGGIYINDDGTVITLDSSHISSNNVDYGDGGGIYDNAANGTITLKNNSTISGNTVSGDGAGIYDCYDGSVYNLLSNSEISNNTAKGDGGGIYLNDVATVNASWSYIKENKAVNGAGIYINDDECSINLVSSLIKKNEASGSGGGIYNNDDDTVVTMKDSSSVSDNTASGSGGGIYSCYNLTVNSTSGSGIMWNKANAGAGIWFSDELYLKDLAVYSNTASAKGGGVYCNNSSYYAFELANKISIYDNTANGSASNLSMKGDQNACGGGGDKLLAAGSRIGVTIEGYSSGNRRISGNQAFVSNISNTYKDVVFSDNPIYSVNLSGNYLYLTNTPSTYKLTCYSAADKANVSTIAYGEEVELKASDYEDNYLEPDWWTVIGLTGTSRLYPDTKGSTSFNMPGNDVYVYPHYPAYTTITLKWGDNKTSTVKGKAGSVVQVETSQYANTDGKWPSWWNLVTEDGITRIPTSYYTTFTMPAQDTQATAYYPNPVKEVSLTLGETNTWESLASDKTDGSYTHYLSSNPVSSLTLKDENRAAIEPSAIWIESSAGVTERTVEDITDSAGNVIQKKATYKLRIDNFILTYYGFDLPDDSISICPTINIESSSLGAFKVSDIVASYDYSDLFFTFTVIYDKPQAALYLVKATGLDINDSNHEIASLGQQIEEGKSAVVKAPEISGWNFVGWEDIPNNARISSNDKIVTISNVGSNIELKAIYEPCACELDLEIDNLSIGSTFPSKLNLATISVDTKRDITTDANSGIEITWESADGSSVGTEVEGDATYKATIKMKLPGSSLQYAFADKIDATINGSTANSIIVKSGTVEVSWLVTTESDTRYGELITDLSDVSIVQASDCKNYLPSTVSYKLKNEEAYSANITWDISNVDYAMTSGSFVVLGCFTDNAGTEHEISRTFTLQNLGAPKLSLRAGTYEEGQSVALVAGSGWEDASDVQIYYAIASDGAQRPSENDYSKYSEAINIDKSCTLYVYAKVGNRQTQVAEYVYLIEKTYAISITSGRALDANGNKISSAACGNEVIIKANKAKDGLEFDSWKVVSGNVELADIYSEETSFKMASADVVLEAIYKAKSTDCIVDFFAGDNIAIDGQIVEEGSCVAKPNDPVRDGYEFNGWFLNGEQYDFNEAVTKNIILEAKWTAIAKTMPITEAKVMLSKYKYAYNGKAKMPSIKAVILNGKILKAGVDYIANINSGKKVGTYVVTVIGNGDYMGKAVANYKIVPAKVLKLKVKACGNNKAKLTWKKAKTQRSGVQIRYSLKKNMKNAKKYNVKKAGAKTSTIKKLQNGKRYYVQVRAYKVVGAKKYYSAWSTKRFVKIK